MPYLNLKNIQTPFKYVKFCLGIFKLEDCSSAAAEKQSSLNIY
jgi:hypothetical protein